MRLEVPHSSSISTLDMYMYNDVLVIGIPIRYTRMIVTKVFPKKNLRHDGWVWYGWSF